MPGSMLEPGVFEAPAVEQAVDYDRNPVHPRIAAGGEPVVENHRPRGVFLQLAVDLRGSLMCVAFRRSASFERARLDLILQGDNPAAGTFCPPSHACGSKNPFGLVKGVNRSLEATGAV